ncbi:MAG: homoserine O-acetyltransferase [Candidatus Omnitrophica bacterium]|nr:homoserine O-acetyltransferase [Candidatus Omnitrophota bacterium]
MEQNPVDYVETQYFTFAEPPNELVLKSGVKIGPVTLAYETTGKLNAAKSNAILILHALTGDAHVTGFHPGSTKPGWWDNMVGPGKAFDTDKYFIICSNVLGSCKGSTGPASINPNTGKPYGLAFPVISIRDMVVAQRQLIDHLGIDQLLCVAGGSMGGFQALKWSVLYPERVRSSIVIAAGVRHSAQQIAFNVVARQAIMSDPDWNGGDYYGKTIPARGLALARMMGHITYMSDKSMQEKFGRKLISKERLGYDFSLDFEVENYLKYRGDSFVQRFDANSWLYLSKALDYFDLTAEDDLVKVFETVQSSFLVIAFTSDWLYPPYQTKEIVKALKTNDVDVSFIEIQSDYGHDAFLVEVEGQAQIISHFLNRMQGDSARG